MTRVLLSVAVLLVGIAVPAAARAGDPAPIPVYHTPPTISNQPMAGPGSCASCTQPKRPWWKCCAPKESNAWSGNCAVCGNCADDCRFIFGSCKSFFGESRYKH